MVRFIFLCMVLVGLSLTVLPAMKIYNGISSQRDAVMAEATPPLSSKEQVAVDTAADLNNIEAAAGGIEGAMEDREDLTGGFRNTAPTALEGPAEPALSPENAF